MTTLRTLIIEDSPDDAALLRRELARAGHELTSERVETAPDTEAALRDGEWDIVFSDWAMPQFSALEALAIFNESGLDLPFIIISGTIGEEVAVEALRSGAHDFFVKGKLALLAPAVERELREAALRRERVQMQEQLMISDRMASVGVLAAGVAHEINNPLAAVVGNLDLALRTLSELEPDLAPSSALRRVLEEVRDAQEAAERIRQVTNDLKLFARSDSEEQVAVDVEAVLESSLRMAQTEIRHRAQLRRDYSPVPRVAGNASRLGQVFLNLVVNAAQSIPEGNAYDNEIVVATMPAADGGVVVEIRDTGSGMSTETQKRLFTPFFTTKPIGVGTGLGLSICHRIVTSFGGRITADSALGAGSTFRVHLLPAGAAAPEIEAPRPVTHAPSRRGRVLLIDDEPAVGVLVQRVLRDDHDVKCTTNAVEALEWIREGARFDVIFCDLMMPHLTGMDFHDELSRVDPGQAARVVFLTGGAFTARARQFLEDVTNVRVEKPFDISALSDLVNERICGSA